MRFIDTHTHLYLPEFEADGDSGRKAVERAIDAGVAHMIFPNVDNSTVEPMERLADIYPDNISVAMGLHPTEIGDGWRDRLAEILEHADCGRHYVAIGEVGIDLYWDKSYEEAQMQVFELQALKAVDKGLPLIIHCRDGLSQALEVLQGVAGVKGVFHSFGGTTEDVDAIRRVGDFYFGINGIVTFKNSKLKDTLPAIGIGRTVIETDSPYLAPVPKRGKRNESSYLPYIAEFIAQASGMSVDDVAELTSKNATELFSLNLQLEY